MRELKSSRVVQIQMSKMLSLCEKVKLFQGVRVKADLAVSELVNYSVFLCFWSTGRMHAELFIKAAKQYQFKPLWIFT